MNIPWLAGFFDGQGCVGLYSNKHHKQVMLQVSITPTMVAERERLMHDIQAAKVVVN